MSDRLRKLKELEADLHDLMSRANSRAYPALARQYRETLREIEELEDGDDDGDPIAGIIANRQARAD